MKSSVDDKKLIDLYWKRSETAIRETDNKYGRYCHTISFNILHNKEDAEECVNDTYLKVWGVIPTLRPQRFSAFIGRITRNLSLNKYEYHKAKKRSYEETRVTIEELPDEKRKVFMQRYWYFSPVKEIASDYGMTESKVKMILLRARNDLKQLLEQEEITL